MLIDLDEHMACNAGNSFYEKQVDNVYIVTGGTLLQLVMLGLCLAKPAKMFNDAVAYMYCQCASSHLSAVQIAWALLASIVACIHSPCMALQVHVSINGVQSAFYCYIASQSVQPASIAGADQSCMPYDATMSI